MSGAGAWGDTGGNCNAGVLERDAAGRVATFFRRMGACEKCRRISQGGASAKDIHALRFDRVGGYSARIGKWMGGSCTTQWSGAFMGCLSIARP